jgi:hypothetical protein
MCVKDNTYIHIVVALDFDAADGTHTVSKCYRTKREEYIAVRLLDSHKQFLGRWQALTWYESLGSGVDCCWLCQMPTSQPKLFCTRRPLEEALYAGEDGSEAFQRTGSRVTMLTA